MPQARRKFTRDARKHRIGRGAAEYVMNNYEHTIIPATPDNDEKWKWVGDDERGRELEVIAVNLLPEKLLVIHVYPTHLREL